ncbi:cellulase family glycosylhydrolase [Pedobacter sp. SYSU D00535]|uniref:glycoside hydrolase 5 family protein n=1 Tax=Pedobacter sp. SYSU D00535 TaxID=2810308 RepID=UPI001A9700E4|nr:cellulase family glycosylhydrolase [Pedobacter sp. SYSU D00535]
MLKSRLLLLIVALQAITLSLAAQTPFVKVRKNQFLINGKPYYFMGTNYWYGGLLALQQDEERGKERLKKELDFLKSQGVNNLRVLVGAEGLGQINGVQRVKPALQPEQGKFDLRILEGLDYLLFELEKREMYAVLFLSNNWEWSGGFLQYLNWNGQLPVETMQKKMSWDELRDNTAKFYTCKPCQEDFQKQVKLVLNHKNKYTNRAYIDEPAIMAWEIANEPRPMRPYAAEDYKKFIKSTSRLIKSIDKNHLLTLGTEGDQGTESMDLFKDIHQLKKVDYLTLHIWPKNWGWFRDTSITDSLDRVIARSREYIRRHEQIANQLQKPLVVEEFGLPRDNHSFNPAGSTRSRDKYFASIFDEWFRSKKEAGSIAGVNFWGFGGTARPQPHKLFWEEGDDFSGDPPQEEQGLNSVFDSDESTWKMIRTFSKPNTTFSK